MKYIYTPDNMSPAHLCAFYPSLDAMLEQLIPSDLEAADVPHTFRCWRHERRSTPVLFDTLDLALSQYLEDSDGNCTVGNYDAAIDAAKELFHEALAELNRHLLVPKTFSAPPTELDVKVLPWLKKHRPEQYTAVAKRRALERKLKKLRARKMKLTEEEAALLTEMGVDSWKAVTPNPDIRVDMAVALKRDA